MTAADKLHNARAIYSDLLVDGPRMLKRFNGTAEQVVWYYDSILKVLESRAVASTLTASLRHAILGIKDLLQAKPV